MPVWGKDEQYVIYPGEFTKDIVDMLEQVIEDVYTDTKIPDAADKPVNKMLDRIQYAMRKRLQKLVYRVRIIGQGHPISSRCTGI
ncbi:MAG: hypothetical protein IT167_22590 [Bryobacterales bacterium]|nr:hypothetical protein [Bryobacterales bacterium]